MPGRSTANRDAVDRAVLSSPEMRAALAERDIAEVFARLQRAGVSQRRIAALTGQSQSEISEILSGRRVSSYDVLLRIADGLGVPRGWMGLGYDRMTADAVGRFRADEEATDVKRRAFLAAAGAAVMASRMDGFVGPTRPLPISNVVAAMSQALLRTGGPVQREPLSVVALTENVRRAWNLRQQTKYEALGKVLPSLIDESDRADNESGDLEQRLRLCVHTYNLASALLKRVGEPHLALVATDRALHVARQIDDNLLIGAAAHRQANVLLSAGRPSEARRVGLAAAAAMDPEIRRSPRGLAMWGALLLTAALAAAQAADEAAAWEILGEAKSVGNMLSVDHADIYAVFGPTNVAIHGTQIAVEIGDGRGAVHRGRGVDVEKLPDGLVERRAQLYIDLARAHALQQQHTDALAMLLRAERASPEEIGISPDASRVVRALLISTPGSAPALRAFADRVGYTEA